MEQAAASSTLGGMTEFEIDHGEAEPSSSDGAGQSAAGRPAPWRPPALLSAAPQTDISAAVGLIEAAEQRRHVVDMHAAGLAAICGLGLSGAARSDPWNVGSTLGLLATIGGLGFAAWRWRHTRLVADELWTMSVPLDDSAIARLIARDPGREPIELQRRADALARVDELDVELSSCLDRFRLALLGAASGTVCGWACAWAGPSGLMTLAGAVPALFGAIIGWQVVDGRAVDRQRLAPSRWSTTTRHWLVIDGFVSCSLLPAVIGGTPLLYAAGGAAAVVAGGYFGRRWIAARLWEA